MTASTTTTASPQTGKKTTRPTLARIFAAYYVDLLICGFLAWIVCFTFAWQSYWATMGLFLFFGQAFWCRDRLNPTAGEFCVGIRYLTSSSSQVVADIKVIPNKLKLNGFLLFVGIVELTLAILLFSGWTFLGKAVFISFSFGPPLSVAYWALAGFAFFICSGYFLSASKVALWVVPVVHGLFLADMLLSQGAWKTLLQAEPLAAAGLLRWLVAEPFPLQNLFVFWSLFVFGTLAFSRKLLVNK